MLEVLVRLKRFSSRNEDFITKAQQIDFASVPS